MKIAHFSDCFFPTVNGVSTSIDSLSCGLASQGSQVMLIVPEVPQNRQFYNSDVTDRQEISDVSGGSLLIRKFSSAVMPQLKDNRIGFPWPFKIWKDIKNFNPKAVHIHTPGTIGLMGLIWAKLNKKPICFTHHTLFEEYLTYFPLPPWAAYPLVLGWLKIFWKASDKVIAPSEEIKLRVEQQGCRTQVTVIPTGVDSDFAENGDPLRLRRELGTDRAPFLYVGRLAYEKSIDFILKALALVKKKYGFEVPFALIGGGPAEEDLRCLSASLGLEKNVHFLGWRSREHLKDYYKSALAFLFASQTETQGLVIIEAESAGLPAVAVKASGVNEAVPCGSPLLSEPGNLESFADHIADLWQNPDKAAALGRLGRIHAAGNFSRASVLRLYSRFYADLAEHI